MAIPISRGSDLSWRGVHEDRAIKEDFDGESVQRIANYFATLFSMRRYGNCIRTFGELIANAQREFISPSSRMLTILEAEKLIMVLYQRLWRFEAASLCHRQRLPPAFPFDLNAACNSCKQKLRDMHIVVIPSQYVPLKEPSPAIKGSVPKKEVALEKKGTPKEKEERIKI